MINNTISAQEAKKVSRTNRLKYVDESYRNIMNLIRFAIEDGEFNIRVNRCIDPDTRDNLMELGYEIQVYSTPEKIITTIRW